MGQNHPPFCYSQTSVALQVQSREKVARGPVAQLDRAAPS